MKYTLSCALYWARLLLHERTQHEDPGRLERARATSFSQLLILSTSGRRTTLLSPTANLLASGDIMTGDIC
jgi:hypothetical protein